MNQPLQVPPFWRRVLAIGLGIAAVQSALIPLAPGSGMVPPDLLYCLLVAWTLRDPRSIPLWLVLALGLFADIMLSRPLGLGTLGLVLATEVARRNAGQRRATPFLVEWIAATVGFALILTGIDAILRLSFADAAGFVALSRYLTSTCIAYPIVAMVVAWGVGLRAPPAERPARFRRWPA